MDQYQKILMIALVIPAVLLVLFVLSLIGFCRARKGSRLKAIELIITVLTGGGFLLLMGYFDTIVLFLAHDSEVWLWCVFLLAVLPISLLIWFVYSFISFYRAEKGSKKRKTQMIMTILSGVSFAFIMLCLGALIVLFVYGLKNM